MSGAFSRSKGQRAEREVVKLLQPVVTEVYSGHGLEVPVLERNLMQSHRGGYDLAGLEWLALEVKHQETLNVLAWWVQTKDQANNVREPVLFYRQSRVKWKVVMFGYLIAGKERVRCPVEVSVDAFLVYFESRLQLEVTK